MLNIITLRCEIDIYMYLNQCFMSVFKTELQYYPDCILVKTQL